MKKRFNEVFDTNEKFIKAKGHRDDILEALSYYRHITVTFETDLFVFNNDFLTVEKVEGSASGILLKTKEALVTIDLSKAEVYAEERFMIFAIGNESLVKLSLE